MNWLPKGLCLVIGNAEWNIDQLKTIVECKISAQQKTSLPSGGSHVKGVSTTTAMLTGNSQVKCSYCQQGQVHLCYKRKAVLG